MKICMVNAHWSNHGDEAAIIAVLKEIIKTRPDAEISVIVKDNKELEDIYVGSKKIRLISNKFLPNPWDMYIQLLSNGKLGRQEEIRHDIRLLETADYLIYAPGGSVINDRFWWRKQLEYLFPFFYAKKWKKPLFVAAPSIGPFMQKYKFRNLIRRHAFMATKYLLLRENLSYDSLKKINSASNAIVTVDSAFLSQTDFTTEEVKLDADVKLKSFISKYSVVVGMTITELDWNVKYKDKNMSMQIYRAMHSLIQYLDKKNIGIILIPQLFGNQNDTKVLEKYYGNNTYLLQEEYNADFQQFLISRLHMVIGMRYHSNIFAAKMGVPFLPIVYEEKMEGFLRDSGLDDLMVRVEELEESMLIGSYERVEEQWERYHQMLKEQNCTWDVKAQTMRELLRDFLI